MARHERASALAGGEELVEAILGQKKNFVQDNAAIHMKRDAAREARLQDCENVARELLAQLTGRARRALEEALECPNGGDWLSHLPLEYLGLDMDRQTFRDAIALRMGRDLPDALPTCCPSCGEAGFDVPHALKCKAGDWVRRRHDEVAKAWMRLFKRVSPTVVPEPHLAAPVNLQRRTTSKKVGARADIMATGTQRPGQNTFYDVAVVDTGAASYLGKKALTVLRDKEQRKTDKYEERAEMLGGTFVPLVCSVYGTLAPESVRAMNKVVSELDGDKPEKRSTGFTL